MFKLNLEMARAAHIAASRKQYRSFGTATALGRELTFEAQLYPDPSQPLAIDIHVIKDGKPVEPFTTLTARVRAYEIPLEGDEIIGDTTDGVGLLRDITINLGSPVAGKRVLLLGAGGASRGGSGGGPWFCVLGRSISGPPTSTPPAAAFAM